MRILFLHGWHSVPGGVKPTYLMDHGHEVINPALDDDDFAAALRTAQVEFDKHQPDVVVGSSRGGAVAMNIKCGSAKLVLLCPAWKYRGTAKTVKPGTVILHSRADDVIPFADSEELVKKSGLPVYTLIEVGHDHRLATPEPLEAMLMACEGLRPTTDSESANAARDDYQNLILASGPVGYWPLRENGDDKSGNGHHGRIFGTPTFVQDETGGWVSLDGNSYFQVASDASFSQPTSGAGLTVEVWMRPHVLTLSEPYIHWLGKGGAGKYEWGFRFYSDDSDRPNRLSAYVWNPVGGCGAGAYFQDKTDKDKWLHITACFQPGDANDPNAGVLIYKNGQFQQGPLRSEATRYHHPPHWRIFPIAGNAPLRFGTRSDPVNCLIGGLAEVAIYSRVLDADKIEEHFQAGSVCLR